jgi:FkbM family methyltransferase
LTRVSVIIPCFNARRWIRDALWSVQEQRLDDVEIIVVDDGSTDGSPDVVTHQFPDVRLLRGDHRGPSAARNLGTRHSTGAFIQYLDADDLLGSGKLDAQLRALADSGADIAYGDWTELRASPSGGFVSGRTVARRIEGDPEVALFTDFWSPPAAYLFRRGIVELVGVWRPELPVIQDARFVLDCALRGGRFVYCPGEAARYRVHTCGSVSTRDPREFTRDCLRNALSVEQWWTEHGGVSRTRKAALVKVYGQVARSSFDADQPTFESACAALERLEPGYVPRAPRSLRMLARVVGYPRAEAIAARYRRAKRRLRECTNHLLQPRTSQLARSPESNVLPHVRLRSIALCAYRVPGVRMFARRALRVVIQRSKLSQHTRQQLHNFFAVDVAPRGAAACRVEAAPARAIRLRLQVRDDLSRYWYFWGYGHYEVGTTQLLRRLLRRQNVFFDVGANIGYQALLAAALLEGRGAVHAFEPWPAVFDDLATNAHLNGFRCLTLNRMALSDRDGESPLFVPDGAEWTTASLVARTSSADGVCEVVPTIRFDTYCKLRNIEHVDVLKIDVEGGELQVLRGMGSLLSRWKPEIILEVLEPFEAELEAFFAETPYRKFRIRDVGLEELHRISAVPHDRNIFLTCRPEVVLT